MEICANLCWSIKGEMMDLIRFEMNFTAAGDEATGLQLLRLCVVLFSKQA